MHTRTRTRTHRKRNLGMARTCQGTLAAQPSSLAAHELHNKSNIREWKIRVRLQRRGCGGGLSTPPPTRNYTRTHSRVSVKEVVVVVFLLDPELGQTMPGEGYGRRRKKLRRRREKGGLCTPPPFPRSGGREGVSPAKLENFVYFGFFQNLRSSNGPRKRKRGTMPTALGTSIRRHERTHDVHPSLPRASRSPLGPGGRTKKPQEQLFVKNPARARRKWT